MTWPLQISYWTVGGFGGETPIVEALQDVKKMGLDGMELSFGGGELVPGVTPLTCEAIRTAAANLGMPLRTMASGNYWGQSLSDPREDVRNQAIAFTRAYIETAHRLGVETILVIPGHVAVPWDDTQPVIPYAQAWELSTASLRECLPLAEELGVNIALENVWNWFLADPMAMRAFVDQFASPRLGVYFDVANVLINGYPEHWIDILGARIKAVHVKNFSRQDSGGGLHGFGDDLAVGDLNWTAVSHALKQSGYTGPVTLEMIPFSRLPNLVLPDLDLARKASAQFKQLLPM